MNNFRSNKIKIVIILIGLVTFSIYYFYPKDDYVMEMVKPINPVVEKIEKIEDSPKKENIVTPKVEEKKENIVEELLTSFACLEKEFPLISDIHHFQT